MTLPVQHPLIQLQRVCVWCIQKVRQSLGVFRVKVTMSAVSSQAGTRGGQGGSQLSLVRVILLAQRAQTIHSRVTIRSSDISSKKCHSTTFSPHFWEHPDRMFYFNAVQTSFSGRTKGTEIPVFSLSAAKKKHETNEKTLHCSLNIDIV